jgi:hypothetical protein
MNARRRDCNHPDNTTNAINNIIEAFFYGTVLKYSGESISALSERLFYSGRWGVFGSRESLCVCFSKKREEKGAFHW